MITPIITLCGTFNPTGAEFIVISTWARASFDGALGERRVGFFTHKNPLVIPLFSAHTNILCIAIATPGDLNGIGGDGLI